MTKIADLKILQILAHKKKKKKKKVLTIVARVTRWEKFDLSKHIHDGFRCIRYVDFLIIFIFL